MKMKSTKKRRRIEIGRRRKIKNFKSFMSKKILIFVLSEIEVLMLNAQT